MSPRSFKLGVVLIAAVVALSPTPFPGALMGFMCAVTVAFFVAPLTFGLQGLAEALGFAASPAQIIVALAALYGLGVLVAARRAWRLSAIGNPPAARLEGLRAIFLTSLPLIAWLSSQALVRAWP